MLPFSEMSSAHMDQKIFCHGQREKFSHSVRAACYHNDECRFSISYYDMVGDTILDLLAENQVSSGLTLCRHHGIGYIKDVAYARVTDEEEALFVFYLVGNYQFDCLFNIVTWEYSRPIVIGTECFREATDHFSTIASLRYFSRCGSQSTSARKFCSTCRFFRFIPSY